jgi:hypothetical protein
MHRKGKPYHLFSHIFRPEFAKYNCTRKECNGTYFIVLLGISQFSIQYHVTINSQLNDQNSIRYYIKLYINTENVLYIFVKYQLQETWPCQYTYFLINPIQVCMVLKFYDFS